MNGNLCKGPARSDFQCELNTGNHYNMDLSMNIRANSPQSRGLVMHFCKVGVNDSKMNTGQVYAMHKQMDLRHYFYPICTSNVDGLHVPDVTV